MKKTILDRFNKSLNKVISQSKEISSILNNNTNLKLHKIVCLDEYTPGDFELFCSEKYEEWKEFLEEHHLEATHIGSTSSFYLNAKYYDMFDYEYNGLINSRNLTKLLCQNSGIDVYYIKVDDNGIIVDLKDIKFSDGTSESWSEYFLEKNTLDDFVADLDDEVKRFLEELEEIKAGYKYIEEFKENQVQTYKEFFGFN